jgi:hypothetical protein
MINNSNALGINSFWSKPNQHSVFDEPILINGIDINKPKVYREEDLWDLDGIFDKPSVAPTGKLIEMKFD